MAEQSCPRCTGSLVEINTRVSSSDLKMRSCSVCDQRFWLADGRLIGLDRMLDELNQRGKLEFKRAS